MKILIIILVIMIGSCGVPKEVRSVFTICYCDTFNPDPENRLLKDGFYRGRIRMRGHDITPEIIELSKKYPDSLDQNLFRKMVFFENGFTKSHWPIEDTKIVDTFFSYFLQSTKRRYYRDWWGNRGSWGLYKISGDTLEEQWMTRAGNGIWWRGSRVKYLIIDSVTIEPLFGYYSVVEKKIKVGINPWDQKETTKLILTQNHPPSNSWLLKQKWFWCKGTFPGRRTIRKRLKSGYYDHPYNTVKPAKRR